MKLKVYGIVYEYQFTKGGNFLALLFKKSERGPTKYRVAPTG